MKLFQYWDQPEPPAEVAALIEGVRAGNPEFEHQLFNEASAARFIAEHQGERALKAFQACAVPAMQADFFRLCALEAEGGLYVDADSQCLQPFASLLETAPHAMIFIVFHVLNNGFMLFRKPGDPFARACLALALDNVEQRRFDKVFHTAGPGIYSAIRVLLDPSCEADVMSQFEGSGEQEHLRRQLDHARTLIPLRPELQAAFRNLTIVNIFKTEPWVGLPEPAYKATDRHWVRWNGDIYRT